MKDNFDLYSWNNKRRLSELRINEDEEDQFASEFDNFADTLAGEIKDELEDKEEKINEIAGVVGIIGYILLSNAVANMLSKMAKKLSAKYKWGKGEAAAKKIYDFTLKLEGDFKKPIGRVVGLFTKDEKAKTMVTDGLFALLLLGLGAKAGTEAFSAVRKSNLISGGVSGLKAALKGKDLATLIQDTISAV